MQEQADDGRLEDLNGAEGRIFRVDPAGRSFELLKETVFDPTTNEGRSRHTIHWTDRTRFVRVEERNGFEGVEGPVTLHLHNLDEPDAAAAAAGEPFVVMRATVVPEGEPLPGFVPDARNLRGRFTADPESPRQWGGTIELNGRAVALRLRGPRARVVIRTVVGAEAIAEGFWNVRLAGRRLDGRFVADALELFPREDPRATDDPALPRVLVIGDSISMNYHEAAKAALAGIANYHRIEGNGGPSDRGVVCAELWLGDHTQEGLHWDLIQFNHGLHDLRQAYDVDRGVYGAHQVSLEDYRANLEKIIAILRPTGARLMWCTTTPVPNDSHGRWPTGTFGRRKDEDLVFNAAAMEVVARHPDILVNDPNTLIRESPEFEAWRQQNDVHFWGRAEQERVGRHVAETIQAALESLPARAPNPTGDRP